MKKHQISALISRFATPAVLILLGLVLIFCPDMASALISKVAGWGLMMAGIVIAVAMVVDGNWSLSKILTILVLVGTGMGCLGRADRRLVPSAPWHPGLYPICVCPG